MERHKDGRELLYAQEAGGYRHRKGVYISSLLKVIEAGWELPFPGGWTEVILHSNTDTAQ